MSLADTRTAYRLGVLTEADLSADPLTLLLRWLDEAGQAGLVEPNAMVLATACQGRPSARMVLLKGLDARGLVFYSNTQSRKGLELADNPHAALVFYWAGLERQVRVEGPVEQVSREEAEAYFRTRPYGSQLAAWASEQSRELPSRQVLEARWQALSSGKGAKIGSTTVSSTTMRVPPGRCGGFILKRRRASIGHETPAHYRSRCGC